jgi:DNA primase
LAEKAGIKLQNFRPENKVVQDEKELLLRINDFAGRYYHQVLIKDSRGLEALEYLKNRGLNQQTIERWQIGYAPEDFHALEQALVKKNVSLNDIIKAGVSSKNDRGQMYDRFRGRITFPIFNYFGETIGFSARLLADNANAAKYVNSPETAIYNKSKILFGLNFAKDAIRKEDEAVIVEGQMDCIQTHQAGFNNVVASSGTALTEQHLAQLGRLTKNLKFCFDSDSVGQAAARRAGEVALKLGFKLKLIILTAAKDPDELVKKSPSLWQKAVFEAVWFLDYYINLAEVNFTADSVEQKHYLSKEVVPFLQYITDPLEQDHYVHRISTRFSISEKVIRDQIKKNQQPVQSTPATLNQPVSSSVLLQKEVLGGLLFSQEFASQVINDIETTDFEDSEIRQLVESIVSPQGDGGLVKEHTVAKEAIFMVESQLEELSSDQQKLVKQLLKHYGLLKINSIKRQLKALEIEIKTAEKQNNKQKVEELNKIIASKLTLRIQLEKAF